MSSLSILFLITSILSVKSVPVSNETHKQEYDLTQFDEVHDQRQNGTENYRVNLDKIVLVYSPPGGLLTAALLAESGLWGEEFNFEDTSKPEEITVIKPETTPKPANETETTTVGGSTESSSVTPSLRRKVRLPGLLKPLLRRQHRP